MILLLSWDSIDFGVLLGLSNSVLHFLGLFLLLGQFLGGLLGLLLGELVELGLLLNSLSEGLGWVGWTELLIIILRESKLFWVHFALGDGLVEHFLLLGVDKESVLKLLLGSFDGLSGLNGVVLLVIGVVESVLNALLHLLLWGWLWELATSVLLSPLDRLVGVGDLFLIVLEDLWSLSSLGLLELLLWSQILHLNFWLANRSVDWVGLDHGDAWNWVIVGWQGDHSVIANRSGLSEGLSILIELQFIVEVQSGVHGLGIGLHGLAHLLLCLLNGLLRLFILQEILIPVLVVALKELHVRFTVLASVKLFGGCISDEQQHC